jgi:cell wall-associated NlpC family hydrolase
MTRAKNSRNPSARNPFDPRSESESAAHGKVLPHACFARVSGEPAGCGALYVENDFAWLDWGATAPDYRGLNGWVHGGYLEATDAEPTGAGSVSGSETPDGDEGSTDTAPPAASPVGERIVNEAMRYLGYPYVWGGTTPAGFDCSGFLYYVINQVNGGGFPRAMEAQVNRGTYVPSDQLQPGDLVFQQNTYQWGLSHAGIYIGNGQFIHAATPGSGVVISDLWDSYWGTRYYTARRIS